MGKSAAEKSSKKRKTVSFDAPDLRADQAATVRPGFQPDSQFKRVHPDALADFTGVEDGSCELWLLQMPRSLQLDAIANTDIDVEEEEGGRTVVRGTITSSFGTAGEGELAQTQDFSLVQELAPLGREHFCLAAMGSRVTLSSLPISRRITLVGKAAMQAMQQSSEDAALEAERLRLPPQQQGALPPSTSKRDKQHAVEQDGGQQHKKSKKEKKENKIDKEDSTAKGEKEQPGSEGKKHKSKREKKDKGDREGKEKKSKKQDK